MPPFSKKEMEDCEQKKTMWMVKDQGVGWRIPCRILFSLFSQLITHIANPQHLRHLASYNQSRSLLAGMFVSVSDAQWLSKILFDYP